MISGLPLKISLGILTGFLASLLGWQINLVAIHRGLKQGRRAAFLLGLGAALGDMLFLATGFFGARSILKYFQWIEYFKWVGIGMLLWASYYTLSHRYQPGQGKVPSKRRLFKNTSIGFLMVVGNPALLMMWAGIGALLTAHLHEARDLDFPWTFLAGFLVGASVWFFFLARFLMPRVRTFSERTLYRFSQITAFVLLLAALALAFLKIVI